MYEFDGAFRCGRASFLVESMGCELCGNDDVAAHKFTIKFRKNS